MKQYIMALDQGTTSSRTIIFDSDGTAVGNRTAGVYPSIIQSPAGWSMMPVKFGRSPVECGPGGCEKSRD